VQDSNTAVQPVIVQTSAVATRIGRSNGKGNPWRTVFSVAFQGEVSRGVADLSLKLPFIRFLSRFTTVYSYTCALLYSCA